jgi:hypothetical protein
MLTELSRQRLATCHPDLIRVVTPASKRFKLAVICGHRGKEDQDRAFREKRSKVRWPNSKHNATPSLAVDLAPLPIDWDDEPRFKAMAMVVLEVAKEQGVKITWGGSWGWDNPHFQLDR